MISCSLIQCNRRSRKPLIGRLQAAASYGYRNEVACTHVSRTVTSRDNAFGRDARRFVVVNLLIGASLASRSM